jgi:hypothetical protein
MTPTPTRARSSEMWERAVIFQTLHPADTLPRCPGVYCSARSAVRMNEREMVCRCPNREMDTEMRPVEPPDSRHFPRVSVQTALGGGNHTLAYDLLVVMSWHFRPGEGEVTCSE